MTAHGLIEGTNTDVESVNRFSSKLVVSRVIELNETLTYLHFTYILYGDNNETFMVILVYTKPWL